MIESKITLGLLALWLIPGLGPRRLELLINELGSPDAVFGTPVATLSRITGLGAKAVEAIPEALSSEALKKELSLIDTHQLTLTDFTQPEYPDLLREIHYAPPLIYSRGDIGFNSGLPVAFVGSRKASFSGKSMCGKLIRQLAELRPDTVIISGLALGIDSAAHKAALEFGLKTIAVLAGGLSGIYPAQNRVLSEKISQNGSLITEFPVLTKPAAGNFPLRNRVISGLSKGVVVVEAGERSGAAITAGYALEQNRELFALPGQADSRFSLGTNRLIQKGQAKLVLQAEDILEEIVANFGTQPNQQLTTCPKAQVSLSDQELIVMSALESGPQHQNHLARTTQLAVPRLLAVLTGLELKGVVVSKPGSIFQAVDS